MRKTYSLGLKSKIAIEGIKGEFTTAEISNKHKVQPRLIQRWRKEALDGIPTLFSTKRHKKEEDSNKLIDELYKQIGQLKVENDWLKKKL